MPKLLAAAAAVAALAALAVHAPASAQTTRPFMTIDSVDVRGLAIAVTGVVQGESSPSTAWIQFSFGTEAVKIAALERCHRQLLLALAKPGQYVVQAAPDLCNVALVAP